MHLLKSSVHFSAFSLIPTISVLIYQFCVLLYFYSTIWQNPFFFSFFLFLFLFITKLVFLLRWDLDRKPLSILLFLIFGHFSTWLDTSLLPNSLWITGYNVLCLVLYTLSASLPHYFWLWSMRRVHCFLRKKSKTLPSLHEMTECYHWINSNKTTNLNNKDIKLSQKTKTTEISLQISIGLSF